MWFEALPKDSSWASLWSDYILCGCGGIRRTEGVCSSCGEPLPHSTSTTFSMPGGPHYTDQRVFMGAEGRYEDWVYLIMLEREWLRPMTEADCFLKIAEGHRPSPRAIVVLVFWTYFETRIERLFQQVLRNLPPAVSQDLLRRNSSMGTRLDRLYKLLFSTTYWADLESLGYTSVSRLLTRVHRRRNAFTHGHPEAIDDALVEELVAGLKEEHESWIAVFNKRIASGVSTTQAPT